MPRLIGNANCPIVQIMEFGKSPVDMLIGFSHRDAARAATRHLIEQGYRRIAFLGASMDPRARRAWKDLPRRWTRKACLMNDWS